MAPIPTEPRTAVMYKFEVELRITETAERYRQRAKDRWSVGDEVEFDSHSVEVGQTEVETIEAGIHPESIQGKQP